MKRNHLLYLIAIALFVLPACSLLSKDETAIPAQVTQAQNTTSAYPITMPALQPSGEPSNVMTNVTCNQLSFYLDPALGSGYECMTISESNSSDIPMDIFTYPTHTELAIQDYPLTRTQFPPLIYIFPLDRFGELLPDLVPDLVTDLERLISGGTASSQAMPFLPPLPMLQSFFSQETILSFNAGKGIRYITDYNEISHPVSNRTIFYTFQGLTDDRKYCVAVTLPVNNPILPADVDFPPPPGGQTLESWFQEYPSYVSWTKEALEDQSPDSFSPPLNLLDNLIESITIR